MLSDARRQERTTSPPSITIRNVATAMAAPTPRANANQRRSARCGESKRVFCHYQPSDLRSR
ncbi:hypothetical protein [Calothrix sp. NIES-2098]|uniref:hypothetical protein n=1 Tax=Calothrix sp. NIES-2098 TaxID=1954171 RepID=UPI0030D9E6B3